MDEQEILKVVFYGAHYEDTAHLNALYSAFDSSALSLNDQSTCTLQDVKKCFHWIPIPPTYHERFQKSSRISTLLRDQAGKALEEKDLMLSLRGYNLSIAFSPNNSKEVILALEKRAELLIQLGYSHLAQNEINSLANIPGYPSPKKLLELQKKCFKEKRGSGGGGGRKLGDTTPDVLRLKAKHPKIDNVADFVEIDYREECGRRIVVTRDVQPGEVLMVDEPYALILEKPLNWDVENCGACSKPTLVGIPCNCCTFGWYCSPRCKEEAARSTHKYEKYLSYLKSSRALPLKALLSARILFKVGARELFRLFLQKTREYEELVGVPRGFNSEGFYSANSYLPIYHLIRHNSHSPSNAFKALLLTHLIEECSSFFHPVQEECREGFKDFITELLLRHMEAIEYNAITLSKLSSFVGMRTKRYGAAVYPLLSLVNHSCSPNCVPLRSVSLLKTSVVAVRKIRMGEEVCISYAPSYASMSLGERRQFLLERYNFLCGCAACGGGWGPGSWTSTVPESQCEGCGKYLLTGQCPRCMGKDVEIQEGLGEVDRRIEEIKRMLLLLQQRNEQRREDEDEELPHALFEDGLKVLQDCIAFCCDHLPENSRVGAELGELFRILLVGIVA